MKNRDIERALARAIERETPDVFERAREAASIRAGAPSEQRPEAASPRRHARGAARAAVLRAAMAACVVVALLLGGAYYRQNYVRFAVLDVDVNPSVELTFSRARRVLTASALNDDAAALLSDMDLRGATVEVAVNALIGGMLRRGYLDENANSVLLSVDAGDGDAAAQLRAQAEQATDGALAQGRLGGAIVSQLFRGEGDVARLSAQYGTSRGKAALIQALIAQNPALTFETLASVPVSDLSLVVASKRLPPEGVQVRGAADEREYIGAAEATRRALEQHGQRREDALDLECEMDFDEGRVVYEVEFFASGREYECTLDARTGDMLEWEIEWKRAGQNSGDD